MPNDSALPDKHEIHPIEAKGSTVVVLYGVDWPSIQGLANLLQKRNPDVIVVSLPDKAKLESYHGENLQTLVKLITAKMTREELLETGLIRLQ